MQAKIDLKSTSILGHAVSRREDPALVLGQGQYAADLKVEGALHAVFVRSDLAHARITAIETEDASEAVGVVGVFTAHDFPLGKLGEFPPPPPDADRGHLHRPVLASDRVRFVGEAYAVVVAETRAQAVDAAALVYAEMDELEVNVNPLAAMQPGAPLLFPEHGSNVVADIPGQREPDPLEGADVIVSGTFHNQRVAPVPLEPGGIVVVPDREGALTVWVSTQSAFVVRLNICNMFGLTPDEVRVIVPTVGGGFGAKGGFYPEHAVVVGAARRLERPVRWEETRSENLVAMTHGRDQHQDVQLGARRDGTITGLRARTVTDVGAYMWRGGIPVRTSRIMASGPYRIPRIDLHSMAVVTNTTPTGPYRGAGRPEATAMLERALDLLGLELGLDPVLVRRRNLLRPDEFPYVTPTGASYDSGDYERALDHALELSGYDDLRGEQRARREQGDPMAMGIGICCFCEVSGRGSEFGSVTLHQDGRVTVTTGASPHGQGHETTLAQVAASILGVDFDVVTVVHSDTGVVPRGTGTFGSRSGQLAGSAVRRSAHEVLDLGRGLAAELLEAAREDIVSVQPGYLSVAGSPHRSVSWPEVAAAAREAGTALSAEDDFAQQDGTYAFGTHIAVVEIDTETGEVSLREIVAVDDCGTILNPLIVAGQIHGGLAQGAGQALYEGIAYDEIGNPLTTTLMDYLIPSAADLPMWRLGETVTPSPRNPLGMKGVGESGSIGAPAAIQSAVLDALAPYGVRHLDPPFTHYRVWRALTGNASGASPQTQASNVGSGVSCACDQAMTGLRSTPSFAISASTTSPGVR